MKVWIKKVLGITALEQENARLKLLVRHQERYVSEKIKELQDYTRVDADMGVRGHNTIILTGVYRNKAYVRFYDVKGDDFAGFVEHLRDLKGHALIRNIDHPPTFHGVFDLINR